ncbi:MAG: hypothetical protein Q8O33_05920 [Pseudomonadota bacterium]|nr:hypothetical protein [Pseudomonadota bacterium]
MSFHNPATEDLKALLTRVKTIAVVGLSPKPDRRRAEKRLHRAFRRACRKAPA